MGSRRGIIKGTLLNQHLLAGLGNLYSDEALFAAGICPQARALTEERLGRLHYSIQEVLRTAIDREADLRELPSSHLIPNRYPGGRCPRDGSLLATARIAGRTPFAVLSTRACDNCGFPQKMKCHCGASKISWSTFNKLAS